MQPTIWNVLQVSLFKKPSLKWNSTPAIKASAYLPWSRGTRSCCLTLASVEVSRKLRAQSLPLLPFPRRTWSINTSAAASAQRDLHSSKKGPKQLRAMLGTLFARFGSPKCCGSTYPPQRTRHFRYGRLLPLPKKGLTRKYSSSPSGWCSSWQLAPGLGGH